MYRADFPFFGNNKTIYLDSAATSQKPQKMIDALCSFYSVQNSNIHRGNYVLSRNAEKAFEESRKKVADFIGANEEEIIFTKGATEALNYIARSISNDLQDKENIVVSDLEHSSAYFPFKRECERRNAEFRSIKVLENGTLDMNDLYEKVDEQTKLLVISGMSNVNGFKPDLEKIIAYAHEKQVPVLVDAAQLIAHEIIDVKKLDCDFLAFSAHKVYGPMGVGCLYVKKERMGQLDPLLLGGGTIEDDRYHDYPLKEGIERFEAGTADVAGVIAFGASLDYLKEKDFKKVLEYESGLSSYLHQELSKVKGLRIVGPVKNSPVVCFELQGYSSYDVGVLLSMKNIAVRCGGHCAYPMVESLKRENLVRVSLGMYNNKDDIDALASVLKTIIR